MADSKYTNTFDAVASTVMSSLESVGSANESAVSAIRSQVKEGSSQKKSATVKAKPKASAMGTGGGKR